MPQSVIIVGVAFEILSAVQGSDGVTFLISYTQPPLSISSIGMHDALNPGNYVVSGPTVTSVVSVSKINQYTFALHLSSAVITGDYTLTVNNVWSGGAGLTGGNSVVIHCVASAAKEGLTEGHENDDADNLIRRFLNPQYRYQNAWEALIAGLGAGDKLTKDNTFLAFLQLFMSSASGDYLIQRAADEGIDHPSNVGMPDDLFRKLAISFTNKKLVHEALLEILEVFYGDLATRANLVSGKTEPYSFTSGDTLSLEFDDRQSITVTFNSSDFGAISAATANEVAAVLTRAFKAAGIHAYATKQVIDGVSKVVIFSGALGLLGSIKVTGGIANNPLYFPTANPLFTSTPNTQWSYSRVSATEFRLTYNGVGTAPSNLITVEVGDFVNLDFANLPSIRGSYEVSVVHFDANTTTSSLANNVWFSIKPTAGFPIAVGTPPATVTQTSASEIIFYRPTRTTVIQNSNPSFVAQYAPGKLDVILPATTKAVSRSATTAAYPSEPTPIPITTTSRAANLTTVVTSSNHGLAVGQMVQLRGVRANSIGRWNSLGKVTNVTGPASFVMADVGPTGTGTGGEVLILTAAIGTNILGPFLADPVSGFAVTAVSTTSTVAISGGRGISTLSVTSSANFPSGFGWLVLGFGTQYEVGPVKYLGRVDATTILIDKSFIFPQDIPSGIDVMLLGQKGPVDPLLYNVDWFYVTDSSSGRVAAEEFVAAAAGSGIDVNYKIIYPGDRGLGGEGQPITGHKISDKVAIWAGDSVDNEIASAHNA